MPRGGFHFGTAHGLALGCFGAAVLGVPLAAHGYVRERSPDGTAVYWSDPRLTLSVADPSSTFGVTPDVFASCVARAGATWSHAAIACTGISIDVAPQRLAVGYVRNDGVLTVRADEVAWCADPVALTNCHDPAAIALTTLTLRNAPGKDDDGKILDADIEINGVDYPWADIPDDITSLRDYANDWDLRNALTHEIGHLVGLWHDCHQDDEDPLPTDTGAPSPACTNAPLAVQQETMSPSAAAADTSKRVLSSDELRASCAIYPYTLQIQGDGGCRAVPGHPHSLGSLGASLLLLLGGVIRAACRPRRARS